MAGIDFANGLGQFFAQVSSGVIEIYNEISLQHEFGFFLRSMGGPKLSVQFERPVTFFGLEARHFEKKEIDVALFDAGQTVKSAVELKYPTNGQYPEQMFEACRDLAFLEQLCRNGFSTCLFVMVVDDANFYEPGRVSTGIYQYFRGGLPICGTIHKPTGSQSKQVHLIRSYEIAWKPIGATRRYAAVEMHGIAP